VPEYAFDMQRARSRSREATDDSVGRVARMATAGGEEGPADFRIGSCVAALPGVDQEVRQCVELHHSRRLIVRAPAELPGELALNGWQIRGVAVVEEFE